MSNTITAYFKGRVGVAESVYQHDTGRVLIIDGLNLPPIFEVHFTILNEEEAFTVIGQNNRVAIPNSCLANPGIVTAYIIMHSGENDAETEYIVRFGVVRRPNADYGEYEDYTSDIEAAIQTAISMLQNPKKINSPIDNNGHVDNGTSGQLLRTKGDGTTEWADVGLPTDEQTAQAVSDWLDDHPEATTTVQDGAITYPKLNASLKNIAEDIADINILLISAQGATFNDKLKNVLASVDKDCRIFLPRGVINIGEINLPTTHRVTFIGAGMGTDGSIGTTIKPIDGSTQYLFGANEENCDFHTFENIQFDGNETCAFGIKGDYATGFKIDRCSFIDFTDTACVLGLGLNYVVDSYFRATNTASCLRLHSDSHVRDSEFSGGNPCITIEASGNRFTSNLINGGLKGIHFSPKLSPIEHDVTPISNNNVITGSYFGQIEGYDVHIDGSAGNATGNILSNNYHEMTYDCNEGAVYANDCKTVQISNVVLRGTANTDMLPAIVLRLCENSIISNVMAYNVCNDVITLDTTSDTVVDNIVARDGKGSFIKLDTAYRNLLNNLDVYNTGSETVTFALSSNGGANIFRNCYRNGLSYSISPTDVLFDVDFGKEIEATITPAIATNTITTSRAKRSGNVVEITVDIEITNALSAGSKILDIPYEYQSPLHSANPFWIGFWNLATGVYTRGFVQNGALCTMENCIANSRLVIELNYITE